MNENMFLFPYLLDFSFQAKDMKTNVFFPSFG